MKSPIFTSQMPATGRAGPRQMQDPGTQSRCHLLVAETVVLAIIWCLPVFFVLITCPCFFNFKSSRPMCLHFSASQASLLVTMDTSFMLFSEAQRIMECIKPELGTQPAMSAGECSPSHYYLGDLGMQFYLCHPQFSDPNNK